MRIDRQAILRMAVAVACASTAAIVARQTARRVAGPCLAKESGDRQAAAGNDTAFTRLEYTSLREESAQARTGQQAILQWSLAAFAALFAAGLLFVSNQDGVADLAASNLAIFVMVFGVALPALAMFACLAWFGELIRMERAGSYLRGLELELTRPSAASSTDPFAAPLRWETFLHQGAKLVDVRTGKESLGEQKSKKQYVGYIGSLLIFVGVIIISLLIAVGSVYFSHRPQIIIGLTLWGFAGVCATIIAAATVGPLVFISLRISQSGRHVLVYRSIDPRPVGLGGVAAEQPNSRLPAVGDAYPAQGLPGD